MPPQTKRPDSTEAEPGFENVGNQPTNVTVQQQSRVTRQQSRARHRSPQKEAPYFWASRNTVKSIIDQTGDAKLVSVYVGLCIMASHQSEQDSFTAEIGAIGRAVGLSYKTTAAALDKLELLNFIRVERQFRQSNGVLISRAKKFDQERSVEGKPLYEKYDRAPSKYTILSIHPYGKSEGRLPSRLPDPSSNSGTPELPILGKESLTVGKRDSLKEKETERERAPGPLSAASPSGAAEGQHALLGVSYLSWGGGQ